MFLGPPKVRPGTAMSANGPWSRNLMPAQPADVRLGPVPARVPAPANGSIVVSFIAIPICFFNSPLLAVSAGTLWGGVLCLCIEAIQQLALNGPSSSLHSRGNPPRLLYRLKVRQNLICIIWFRSGRMGSGSIVGSFIESKSIGEI